MGDDAADELEGIVDSLLPKHVRKSLLAGSIGGLTTTLALAPLGVVKTRVQARSMSVGTAVRGIFRASGISGFWSGVRVGLLQTVPSNTIYMGTYEAILREVRTVPQFDFFSPAISGALARSFTVTVMAPLELIRTRQMGGHAGSMGALLRETLRAEGIKGLYRGWSSTVLRDSIFSAVYWLGFEYIKPHYVRCVQDWCADKQYVYYSHTGTTRQSRRSSSSSDSHTNCNNSSSRDSSSSNGSIDGGCGDDCSRTNSGIARISKAPDPTPRYSNSRTINTAADTDRDMTCGDGDFWIALRNPMAIFAAGSSAGVFAAVLTHPFDLLKTRIQVRGVNEGVLPQISSIKHDYVCKHCNATKSTALGGTDSLPRTANLRCMATYLNELLFKGLPLRLAMIIPGAGIMITVYETVKNWDI
jgi:hypothetical protein